MYPFCSQRGSRATSHYPETAFLRGRDRKTALLIYEPLLPNFILQIKKEDPVFTSYFLSSDLMEAPSGPNIKRRVSGAPFLIFFGFQIHCPVFEKVGDIFEGSKEKPNYEAPSLALTFLVA